MTPAALPEVEGPIGTWRKHRESPGHTISRSTTYVRKGKGKRARTVPRVSWSCSCGEEWPLCDAARAFLSVCDSGKMSRKHWQLHAAGEALAAVCRCNRGRPVELVDEPPGPPQPPPAPEHAGEFPSEWRGECFCGSGHQTRRCAPAGAKHHEEHRERLRVAEEREAARDPRRKPLVWDPSGRKGGRFVAKTKEAAERAAEVRREAFAYLDRVDQALERARARDEARRERARARRAAKKKGSAK